MLKANRYPDAWEFSNETPAPPPDYPKTDKVKVFVDIFLTPQFFKKVVLWTDAGYYIDKGLDCRVIDYLYEAEEIRYGIENLALTGHLTVLFVPQDSDTFIEKIISGGHYGIPKQIIVGDHGKADPLLWKFGQNIEFIESSVFQGCDRIFTFSHDAEYLYIITTA